MASIENSKQVVDVECVGCLDRLQEGSVHFMSNLSMCIHMYCMRFVSNQEYKTAFILWNDNNDPEKKA